MNLSNEEINFIISELDNTPIMSEDDMKYIKSSHNYMYLTVHNIPHFNRVLNTEKCWFYTLKNETLNKFICNKFGESINNLYTIHRLIYNTGGECKRHKDRFTTHKTVSLLLSDKFEGGDMYINGIKHPMNNLGDYVCFNGGKDFHEVKPITNGIRDVLIIWFSNKKPKFSLI